MKALYFLRIFFISPEFLLILLACYLFEYSSILLLIENIKIFKEDEFAKWLSIAPITLGIYNIKSIKASNFLKEDTRKLILKWPNFWRLKAHLLISFIYSVIFILISIYSLIFFKIDGIEYYTYVFFIGFIGECILYITIHLAEDKLIELLNQSQG